MSSTSELPSSGPVFGVGERATVYEPDAAKQSAAIACSAMLILVSAGIWAADFLGGLRGTVGYSYQIPILATSAFSFVTGCVLGGIVLIGLKRGWPRLTVTSRGITLETLFGTSWASWSSLGEFTTIVTGLIRRRTRGARALVTGTEASKSILRLRNFTIRDWFQTPIADITGDIRARQAEALGQPQPIIRVENGAGLAPITPWLTFALLVMLATVFLAEQIFAVAPPGRWGRARVETLLALGGLSRPLVAQGEWYRLFTAPLLHLNLMHIAMNGVALLLAGWMLESLIGRAWLMAFFVVGACAGSLTSLALSPDTVVSVGASGAIMGLFAALFVFSFHLPAGKPGRHGLRSGAFRFLVPALWPVASSGSAIHIDYAAHLGGALSGGALAFVLLKMWPAAVPLPRFRGFAAIIAAVGVILTVVSIAASAAHYAKNSDVRPPAPRHELSWTTDQVGGRASE